MLGKFSIFSSRSYNYKDNGVIFTVSALSRVTVGANHLLAGSQEAALQATVRFRHSGGRGGAAWPLALLVGSTRWKEHDASRKALDRLLRDLRVEKG